MSLVVPILGFSILLLILLGLLVWGVRTCRALWRRGTTPWGRLVYNYGVRGFGSMMAVSLIVTGGYVGATVIATSSGNTVLCAIGLALLAALFGTPVALGLGYVWGTWMAFFYGLKPDAEPMTKSLAPNNRWRGP